MKMEDLTVLQKREIILGRKTFADFGVEPLTHEQKIELVAQRIVNNDMINPLIFRRALSAGGLEPWDSKKVLKKMKELTKTQDK